MPKIIEKIIEPNKIIVGSIFKLKVKVEDDYYNKKILATENGVVIISEDGKRIRTEWGK